MNERIRELEKQATETVRCGLNGTFTAERFNRKKFAELIVQECVKVITDDMDSNPDDETFNDALDHAQSIICEHFGVEE